MVRIKEAKGGWKDLDPEKAVAERFQRTNGTKMSDDEVAAIAKGTASVFTRKEGEPPRRRNTSEEIWKAVERLGTQTAAARELGTTQGNVQSGLKTYMKAHGLSGPLPGLLSVAQLKEAAQMRAAKFTAERMAAHPAHVDEPKAAEPAALTPSRYQTPLSPVGITQPAQPKTIPLAEQIAGQDPDSSVDDDTLTTAMARGNDQARRILAERDAKWESPASIELTEKQAELVLIAVEADQLIGQLRVHGYDLVLRLRREVAV